MAVCSCLGLTVSVASADIGVDVRFGTLGTGVMLFKDFGESFSVGLALNTYDRTTDKSVDDIDYDFGLDFKTVGLLANWHPFNGTFRLTAGLYKNDNKVDLAAKLTPGQTYTVGDSSYVASASDSIGGNLTFNDTASYLGVGWGGAPGSTFGLSLDIGALYQASPKLSLAGTGVFATGAGAADVETERQQAEDDLKEFRWYPVFSAGLYYRF
jgi:hypothetical protein